MIITKDIHFNKEKVFDGSTEILKCDVKNISLEYLVEVVRNITRRVTIIILPTIYNYTAKNLEWFYKSKGNKEKIRSLKDLVPAWRNEYIITVFELLLTPPNTSLKCLFTTVLIMVILKNTPSKNPLNVWEYEFKLV